MKDGIWRKCKLWRIVLAAVFVLSAGLALQSDVEAATNDGGKVVAGYTGIFRCEAQAAWKSGIPYDQMTHLGICFLLAKQVNGASVLAYENSRDGGAAPAAGDSDADRIDRVIREARAKNPQIHISLVLTYSAETNAAMLADPQGFAASVLGVLKRHHGDGFEMDYEESATMTAEQLEALVPVLSDALHAAGKTFYLDCDTASPDYGNLSAELVNDNFDLCLVQSYNRLNYIDDFIKLGVDRKRLIAGYCIEWDKSGKNFDAAIQKAQDTGIGGIFMWRADSDLRWWTGLPDFTYTRRMYQAFYD